jgi:D-tyrosyl-tRNA(Tyr) deacylase
MRAVVQRVDWARVKVDGEIVGAIGPGLLVLLGAGRGDGDTDAEWMAQKVVNLRVFEDEHQNMNRALLEVGGALLVVSQFTLYGDCRKGRRPSFVGALEPREAERLCDLFATRCRDAGVKVESGRFRAMMDVELCNKGPVTMLLDSRKTF